MARHQLGVIGLGTMGANLARNAARNNAEVVIYNRTGKKTDAFMSAHGSEGTFVATKSLKDLVAILQSPRPILMMVNAGAPVDQVIAELKPHLSRGDILIDGGNSHFTDTDRRIHELASHGIEFLGMGVSGGEEGALHGPSMMPGGSRSAYQHLHPLLTKMAAKDGSGGRCVIYVGPGGSGHFVKMVHNGIEYGDMQLICEAYHLLRYVCGLSNDQIADLFDGWNSARDLKSFLIGMTAKVLRKRDPETGKHLIDVILDKAGQKGTGKWTTNLALDLGVMIPTITAAVDARIMSAHRDERVEAAKLAQGMKLRTPRLTARHVRSALLLSKVCSYAQGFALVHRASTEEKWQLNLAEICRIWKGGCIIRSTLLKEFQRAFADQPSLKNLLLDAAIMEKFAKKHLQWRKAVVGGVTAGIPLPAMAASLSYFDSYTHDWLPQNLLQAQRDFFGAHTYERVDKQGTFHTQWE